MRLGELRAISMPRYRGGLTPEHSALKNFINESHNTKLSVGFLGNEAYEDGEQVGDVARSNEFGDLSENKPPRPFMRPAIDVIENNAQQIVGRHLGFLLEDIHLVFEDLGRYSVGQVVDAIHNVTTPPLASLTISERRKRGNFSDKPLEDTLKMVSTVDYEVTK